MTKFPLSFAAREIERDRQMRERVDYDAAQVFGNFRQKKRAMQPKAAEAQVVVESNEAGARFFRNFGRLT